MLSTSFKDQKSEISSNEMEKILELQNSNLLKHCHQSLSIQPSTRTKLTYDSYNQSDSLDVSVQAMNHQETILEQHKTILENFIKTYHSTQDKFLSPFSHNFEQLLCSNNPFSFLKYKTNEDLVEDESSKKTRDYQESMLDLERDDKMDDEHSFDSAKNEDHRKFRKKELEEFKMVTKQRKTNFTSKEVEALLNCVKKEKDVILFGVAGGRGWAKAWQDIAKVSITDMIISYSLICRKPTKIVVICSGGVENRRYTQN